jgi:putative FmdB family regulatory protein
MPTYVYECSSCSDIFEIEQRITENAIDECHCGSKGTVKRLIQPVAVMFNGSGFHINDYASATAPAKPAEGPEKTDSSETAAPSTESPAPAAAASDKPATTP